MCETVPYRRRLNRSAVALRKTERVFKDVSICTAVRSGWTYTTLDYVRARKIFGKIYFLQKFSGEIKLHKKRGHSPSFNAYCIYETMIRLKTQHRLHRHLLVFLLECQHFHHLHFVLQILVELEHMQLVKLHTLFVASLLKVF